MSAFLLPCPPFPVSAPFAVLFAASFAEQLPLLTAPSHPSLRMTSAYARAALSFPTLRLSTQGTKPALIFCSLVPLLAFAMLGWVSDFTFTCFRYAWMVFMSHRHCASQTARLKLSQGRRPCPHLLLLDSSFFNLTRSPSLPCRSLSWRQHHVGLQHRGRNQTRRRRCKDGVRSRI